MTMVSVKETVQDGLGRPVRSVLRDVFGVQGVNSRGRRTRSLSEQLERIRTQAFVRVACVTIRPPGSSGEYPQLQRDLDSANDTFLERCGVWIYCTASEVVTTDVLGNNVMLDQDDCNAGWLLDFIGIGDHDVSHEEDHLFGLGRDLGADVVCYFLPQGSTDPTLGGCAAHPDGRRGFWVRFDESRWIFSHELGHVVGDLGHDDSTTNLMYDTPYKISVTPPVIKLYQCADITQDPDIEAREDDTDDRDERPAVERALEARCGKPLVEEQAVTAENRAVLQDIAENPSAPPERRARAVHLLGHWPDEQTAAVLARILDELDDRGRIAAVSVLGRIDTPTAVDNVIDVAEQDPSPDVRRIAINALGRSGTPAARQALARAADRDDTELNRRRARELHRD